MLIIIIITNQWKNNISKKLFYFLSFCFFHNPVKIAKT